MIRGRLETLLSQGFIEGWAFDSEAPHRPLTVKVLAADGALVAAGLANRYREDLVRSRIGIGWCAFRLKTARPAPQLRRSELNLVDHASGARIGFTSDIGYAEGWDTDLGIADASLIVYPFALERVNQLRACEPLFEAFARRQGLAAFVRAAYVYILGRPADAEGLSLYPQLLRQGSLSPFALLETLAESPEFKSRQRTLPAPNATGFPFVEADHAG